MSDSIVHVRHAGMTYHHFPKLVGKELPMGAGIAFCGYNASHEFMYLDAEHALLDIEKGTGLTPCKSCLRRMRAIIDAELEGETVVDLRAWRGP